MRCVNNTIQSSPHLGAVPGRSPQPSPVVAARSAAPVSPPTISANILGISSVTEHPVAPTAAPVVGPSIPSNVKHMFDVTGMSLETICGSDKDDLFKAGEIFEPDTLAQILFKENLISWKKTACFSNSDFPRS
jgi:hypothetical protein